MAQTLAASRPPGGNLTPLVRARLLERLESAAQFPITMLIAPAGYGKSVLLRQYFNTVKTPNVRFTLRAEHGELLGFLRGLAEALAEYAPHAISSLAGAYERNQTSPRRAADLARWMQAHVDESFSGTIAIDDLHNGDGDADIARFVTTLIELCKGKISWVLASRSSAGLPVASWLAYRDADLPIGEVDLRFTLDEATAAAGEAGLRIGQDETHSLLQITEGWPAALTFALTTSTRSSDLRNVSAATREMTYRFLAEQVYNALTADERELLEVAIALPTIDIVVLERAGFDRALQIVEGLHERTAFISQESSNVYRCHDLFRDFLRHQSALNGKRAQQQVNKRAAKALESGGDIEHAVAAYAAAGAKDDLLRLLETHGFNLLERAQSDVVAKAIDALDEGVRRRSGCALALQGALYAMTGRAARAAEILRRALTVLGSSDELVANAALRLASIEANAGKDACSILSRIESDTHQHIAYRVEAVSFIAAQKAVNGHYQAAAMAIDRSLKMLGELETDSARARSLHKIGIAYHHLGRINLAEEALRLSSEIATELHLFAVASRANAVLSNLALHSDDFLQQLRYATLAREAAAKAGDTFALQTATLQVLSANTSLGRNKEAEALEQSLLALGGNEVVNRHVSILRAVRLAWEGKFDAAHRLLSQTWLTMPFDFDRMTCGAACALFLAFDGRKRESASVIEIVIPIIEKCNAPGRYGVRAAATARSFCALAEAVNGRITHAQRLLKDLKLENDVVCGLFYEIVHDLARFIGKRTVDTYGANTAVARLMKSDYCSVAKILKACCDRLARSALAGENSARLTSSEIMVLKDLDVGFSAKEIAEVSGRSINTVRVHIANALTKLECHGQAQAIRSAKKLGLI